MVVWYRIALAPYSRFWYQVFTDIINTFKYATQVFKIVKGSTLSKAEDIPAGLVFQVVPSRQNN
jgi:hypothetical protein